MPTSVGPGMPEAVVPAPELLSVSQDGPDRVKLYGGFPPVTDAAKEPGTPVSKGPDGQLAPVNCNGGGAITNEHEDPVTVCVPLLTLTLKLYVPEAVGVPTIAPP